MTVFHMEENGHARIGIPELFHFIVGLLWCFFVLNQFLKHTFTCFLKTWPVQIKGLGECGLSPAVQLASALGWQALLEKERGGGRTGQTWVAEKETSPFYDFICFRSREGMLNLPSVEAGEGCDQPQGAGTDQEMSSTEQEPEQEGAVLLPRTRHLLDRAEHACSPNIPIRQESLASEQGTPCL